MSDPRGGYPESGTVTVGSGDGDTPQTVIDIRDDVLFSLGRIKVEYASAATVNATLSLVDEADGTANGDVSDTRESYDLAPGDDVTLEDRTMRDFEEGVLVHTGGSQDGDIHVSVEGSSLDHLRDMTTY